MAEVEGSSLILHYVFVTSWFLSCLPLFHSDCIYLVLFGLRSVLRPKFWYNVFILLSFQIIRFGLFYSVYSVISVDYCCQVLYLQNASLRLVVCSNIIVVLVVKMSISPASSTITQIYRGFFSSWSYIHCFLNSLVLNLMMTFSLSSSDHYSVLLPLGLVICPQHPSSDLLGSTR